MRANQLISSMVDHTSVKHANLINRMSQPLAPLGISYFCYQFISNKGDWFTLGNHSDWLHDCADKETHLHDPSLLPPAKIAEGIFLPEQNHNETFQRALVSSAKDHYDIAQCMAISKKDQRGSSCFFFAGSKDNQNLMTTYFNNINTLKTNYTHFVENQISPIFDKCLAHSVNLAKLNNPTYLLSKDDFFEKTTLKLPELDSNLKTMFQIRADQLYTLGLHQVRFTQREADCINLLLNGYTTSKEIAKQLHISHRTVEEHITHARKKARCQKTLDLVKLICGSLYP